MQRTVHPQPQETQMRDSPAPVKPETGMSYTCQLSRFEPTLSLLRVHRGAAFSSMRRL